MKFHIGLQLKIINRHLKAAGSYPVLVYIGAVFTFFGLSIYLFNKSVYAEYIYSLTALLIISTLNSKNRNDFLKNLHTKENFYKVKIIENSLISLPFLVFLMYEEKYIISLILLLFANLMSFVNLESKTRLPIPTPFYRYPFEFIEGFRKTYIIVLVAYFINLMGILAGNLFLSIFGLIVILLNCLSFYSKPEPPFFVWIFSVNPKKFIKTKLQVAVIYTLLLCLPITASVSFFFLESIYIIFAVQLIGLLVTIAAVLAKYAQYPSEINIIQGISIGLSIAFPFLFFVIIPVFYFQSIKRLNPILK